MFTPFPQVLGFLYWTVTTLPTNLWQTTLPLFGNVPPPTTRWTFTACLILPAVQFLHIYSTHTVRSAQECVEQGATNCTRHTPTWAHPIREYLHAESRTPEEYTWTYTLESTPMDLTVSIFSCTILHWHDSDSWYNSVLQWHHWLPILSCSCGDSTAEYSCQSVHSDLYLHHLTCYHCRVDKGWNHTIWHSLPALTGGDQPTVFYLRQHFDFEWNWCKYLRELHLHCQQQIWNQQSSYYDWR